MTITTTYNSNSNSIGLLFADGAKFGTIEESTGSSSSSSFESMDAVANNTLNDAMNQQTDALNEISDNLNNMESASASILLSTSSMSMSMIGIAAAAAVTTAFVAIA